MEARRRCGSAGGDLPTHSICYLRVNSGMAVVSLRYVQSPVMSASIPCGPGDPGTPGGPGKPSLPGGPGGP